MADTCAANEALETPTTKVPARVAAGRFCPRLKTACRRQKNTARFHVLDHVYSIRHGLKRRDDWLTARFLKGQIQC